MRQVFDTQSQTLHTIPETVGLYTCGPTVYSRIHLGNARPYIIFSLFASWLRASGHDVTWVSNLTDINDKIDTAAKNAGVNATTWSQLMSNEYRADTDRLGLARPDREPTVTQSRQIIIDLIQTLLEKGVAYQSGGDIYFSVESFPDYGWLSHQSVDDMQSQGEDAAVHAVKQHPQDFALWKAAKSGQTMLWDAPWGTGRPGWHIECSAMAEDELGLDFAIHGGGGDLVFPHHENEHAQTHAAHGVNLAQTWMHTGMIEVDGIKGSKTDNNIAPLHVSLDEWGVETVIMFIISGHYRQPVEYNKEAMVEARARVDRIRDALSDIQRGPSHPHHLQAFEEGLSDDFNTPRALAAVFAWIRDAHIHGGQRDELLNMLKTLGLDNLAVVETVPDAVQTLFDQRVTARAARDFVQSDALREQIAALGWTVKDDADGSRLIHNA